MSRCTTFDPKASAPRADDTDTEEVATDRCQRRVDRGHRAPFDSQKVAVRLVDQLLDVVVRG